MTAYEKLNLYKDSFVSEQQRRWALSLLLEAQMLKKDLDKLILVFDRWGGVNLMEAKQ